MLLQNLTQLRQISLAWVNISSAIFPANLSSSLMLLDLSETGLRGNLPDEVFHLPNLEMLMLSGNMDLTIYLQKEANVSSNSPLRWIDISYCNFSGGLIANFFAKLRHISHLNLQFNHLNGPIPSSIGNLTALVDLDLSSNSLTGPIPSSIGHLTQLVDIDFSSNSLTGPIPYSIGNLTQLVNLDLSFNSLTGPIPSSIGDLTQLLQLDLSSNSLTGQIMSTIYNLTQLVLFDLSSNSLSGPISHSITKLKGLQYLELSRNSLIGIVELSMFSNLPDLSKLDLSENNLSVRTTNIDTNGTFPNFSVLGLSSCKVKEFQFLLRPNPYFTVLDLRHNNIQGPLPSTICNLTSLFFLDLSHNNLSGEILPCLGNFSNQLHVLNLEANNFHGTIPITFAKGNMLRNINLNGNQLEGKLPCSLANCKNLEILDLGNNHLNDTFPVWLGALPELKILVLKSNIFHGSIPNSAQTKSSFSKLRIIDLSNNEFSGLLPSKYFRYFKDMMKVEENSTEPKYIHGVYYDDSVKVVMKGMERELVKILTVFTTIDMSNNKFEGEIPNYIGKLLSLRELNLSHNKLVGRIPPLLGNLSMLESLDLSFNQLKGEIPQQLTGLISLAFLNLSQNHLVGCIPKGKQFNTFENDSYSGNSALCGFPLLKDCGGDETPHQRSPTNLQQDDDSDFESGFTWKVVCLGYGCGTIFGLVMGYLMFLIGKPKRLTGLVEKYQYKNGLKRGRQRRARRRN
ncbi:hypothetical protein LguiB_006097 [Lonicera macranthoides]